MTDWDLAPGEVLAHLLMWQHSVLTTASRILDPDAGEFSRQADAHLFAMAVRQAVRFAELCRAVAPPTAAEVIGRALDEFEANCPDAKSVRDVLDHLDEYLRGRSPVRPARPPEAYTTYWLAVLRPTSLYTEYTGETYRLLIKPTPDHPQLVLDVTREMDGVTRLVRLTEAALRLPPVS